MNDHPPIQALLLYLDQCLLGKQREVRLSLACLLSGGHLLLEDVPGVGKTTLAAALAQGLGLESTRIQFTSDLMPSEITGGTIFDRESQDFVFRQGPIFTQLVVADEINRATPRTQSALLEAMSETSVSIDGKRYALDSAFTVIATQNPALQTGTYLLPESQLDRFTMCLSLGYPDPEFERELLSRGESTIKAAAPDLLAGQLTVWRDAVSQIHCSDSVIDYLHRLLAESRNSDNLSLGVSPRGGQQWLAAARAWAFLSERDHVLPDDIQAVAVPIAAHRCVAKSQSKEASASAVAGMLESVPVVV
jgi:MoxR-like ATPase